MRIPIFQVDAFSSEVFRGNPAAVCPLENWLSDSLLKSIADENNLSETAFLARIGDQYEIRWFTPTMEVELCGHATLASAYILFSHLEPGRKSVQFQSRKSGVLTVETRDNRIELDFPKKAFRTIPPVTGLKEALGVAPEEQFLTSNDTYLVLLASEEKVHHCRPDFHALEKLGKCVSITAPGKNADFVSRYFAPTHGIPEDPVTGSSFCFLAPFWEKRLRRQEAQELRGIQISRRAGEVFCRVLQDRVKIAGKAVLYLEGSISIGN